MVSIKTNLLVLSLGLFCALLGSFDLLAQHDETLQLSAMTQQDGEIVN
jgi:hypothetical protein